MVPWVPGRAQGVVDPWDLEAPWVPMALGDSEAHPAAWVDRWDLVDQWGLEGQWDLVDRWDLVDLWALADRWALEIKWDLADRLTPVDLWEIPVPAQAVLVDR